MATYISPPVPTFPVFIHIRDRSGKSWHINLNHIVCISSGALEIWLHTHPEYTTIKITREQLDSVLQVLNVVP